MYELLLFIVLGYKRQKHLGYSLQRRACPGLTPRTQVELLQAS